MRAQLDRLLASPPSGVDPASRDVARLQLVSDKPLEPHPSSGRLEPLGKRSAPRSRDHEPEDNDTIEVENAEVGRRHRDELGEPRRLMPERFRLERRHIPAMVVIAVLALGLTLFSIMRAQSQTLPLAVTQAAPPASSQAPPSQAPSAPAASAARLEIHVTGAVRKPGVVLLEPGARVHDALDAAGGVRKGVKTGTLNLAQPLTDGQQVFVGSGKEESGVRSGAQGSGGTASSAAGGSGAGTGSGLINLNTASATELEQLPGVGPVMAGKIVDWRASHDRFSAVTELQEIDGVGPKTYARLAPLVTV